MKRWIRVQAVLLLLLFAAGSMAGCQNREEPEYRKTEDFAQARIGVMLGSSFDLLAMEYLPDAHREYCRTPTDLIINLEQGKIDGILMDTAFFAPMSWENKELTYLETDMPPANYAVAFPMTAGSEPLRQQINEFIAARTRNGWLEELSAKWFGSTEPDGSLDLSLLTGENGTLRVAATLECKPFDYLKNGALCGFDADFIYAFAMEYGYALELETMGFSPMMSGIESGRYDLALSGITVTEEREESLLFSDPYCSPPVVMAVRDTGETAAPTLADLEHAVLGVVTGSSWDLVVQTEFPSAERKYFSTYADLILALEQGKVDAFFTDQTMYAGLRWENSAISCIPEPFLEISNALILAKNGYDETLLRQINDFVAESRANGTLDALSEKWFGDTEPAEHPDYTGLTGENGTLRIAVGDSMKPAAYRRGDMYTGYEVDFLTLFAEAYGYRLEMDGMVLDALISSVAAGKYDIGACGLTITPERTESVTFPESHFETYGVAVIRNTSDRQQNTGWFDSVSASFEKTFLREARWKLILEGIGVTLLISVCSVLGGTAAGLGLYLLSRSKTKLVRSAAAGFAKVYSRIIAGTPLVVILMILFYVVFGNAADISGILVAVIAFTLTFGAFVYGHMQVSVSSVGSGQTDAAYALGYPKNKAFFRILLPQAMKIFLPTYCSQAVDLVKATAVVGYIAVNDLTKMGDIIRSNTYEAFFPLIAVAVIYFLLTWLLSLLLGLVRLRFDPRRRSREKILKGIRTKDAGSRSV